MNRIRRFALSVSPVIALGALATGCSAASSAASGASSPAAAQAPATASSSLPGGTQLGKALLPASAMPSGFSDDSSGDRNSGQQLPSDTVKPVPASQACDLLGATGWIQVGGIQTNAFAEKDYVNSDHSAEIGEEADTFTGSDAEKAMSGLWRAFGKCAKFTEHSDGNNATVTITRKKLTGSNEGIEAVAVSAIYEGGTTIAAVRVGNVIVTTIDSSPKSDNGGEAVTYAQKIAANLSQAQ